MGWVFIETFCEGYTHSRSNTFSWIYFTIRSMTEGVKWILNTFTFSSSGAFSMTLTNVVRIEVEVKSNFFVIFYCFRLLCSFYFVRFNIKSIVVYEASGNCAEHKAVEWNRTQQQHNNCFFLFILLLSRRSTFQIIMQYSFNVCM